MPSTRNMHPQVIGLLRAMMAQVPSVFLSGFRSFSEQTFLFENRGTLAQPVARPGESQHEYGFAFDLKPAQPERLNELVLLGISLGLSWFPNDRFHFQLFNRAQWETYLSAARAQTSLLPQLFAGLAPGVSRLPIPSAGFRAPAATTFQLPIPFTAPSRLPPAPATTFALPIPFTAPSRLPPAPPVIPAAAAPRFFPAGPEGRISPVTPTRPTRPTSVQPVAARTGIRRGPLLGL